MAQGDWFQTAFDVFAHRLVIDADPTRDRRDAQPLPVKIQDHDELPKLNRRLPSRPAEGIIERRAARLPGARPGKPGITPGEFSNGAFGENHSGSDRRGNPQAPGEMITGTATPISSQYHQLKAGGDIAALYGLCKALIEADDRAKANGGRRVLDESFIAEHTHGFAEFAEMARGLDWADLEKRSALTRGALEAAAIVYAHAERVIGIYGMGLTQHRKGVETVQMLVNLLLLRGNIGKPGAGICPVRGHSNVQGQRTVGITEKPELVPLDKLARQFGFEPARDKGPNTVEACEKILSGEVRAFFGLGGNFDAVKLAEGLKAALAQINIAKR